MQCVFLAIFASLIKLVYVYVSDYLSVGIIFVYKFCLVFM